MSAGWRLWAIAAGLSLLAHGAGFAVSAVMGSRSDAQEERSAGAPAAVWGISASAMSDQLAPAEPVQGAVEPETSQQEAEEIQETAKPVEQAQAVEPNAVEPKTAEPVEPVVSETEAPPAAISPLAETSRATVSEVKPREAEEPEKPETLAATGPPVPAPPKTKPVQRATSGGAVGQRSGNSGRQSETAGRADVSSYSGRVAAHLRRYKRYPREAERGRIRGTVRLTFVIGANGSLRGASITGSSGSGVLDREALATVRRAAPFPPFPSNLRRSSMTFRIPIHFAR